jgi:hypothetical protein
LIAEIMMHSTRLEHHVDFLLPQQRQGGLAARDRQDAVVATEDRGNRLPHALIVVANQDGFRGRRHRKGDCIKASPKLAHDSGERRRVN